MNSITLKQFLKMKPIIKVDTILNEAFDDKRSGHRVKSKIYRKSPDFTDEEREKIGKVFSDYGIDPLPEEESGD